MATIGRVVTFHGEDNYTDEEDWTSDFAGASFREALKALRRGCWDSIDWRNDELIAYPADWHQDLVTGAYDSETLVIRARREEWMDRLARAYDR